MAKFLRQEDLLRCCASKKFAEQMAAAGPFADINHAVQLAQYLWFNKIDVYGWLEAIADRPSICSAPPFAPQEEQSIEMCSAGDSALQELVEWSARYREKFGFEFVICVTGRGTLEILAEIKKRYLNRPIVELQIAAEEEMKITELGLARLFSADNEIKSPSIGHTPPSSLSKIEEAQRSRIKWTPPEDKLLISAWLNVSKDPISGNDQKMDGFWKRIETFYNSHRSELHPRAFKSLKDRWHRMSAASSKFVVSYDQSSIQLQTGSSDKDILDLAHQIYKNQYGSWFSLEHAWRYLKNEPKWRAEIDESSNSSKRSKISSSGVYVTLANEETPTSTSKETPTSTSKETPTSVNEEMSTSAEFVPRVQRPARKKEPKRMARINSQDMQTSNTNEEQNKVTNAITLAEMAKFEREKFEYEVLVKDTSNMTEEQRRNHEFFCERIRQELRSIS